MTRLARAMTRNGRLAQFEGLPFARRFRKFDDFVAVLRGLVPRVDAEKTLLVPSTTPSIYLDEFLAGLADNPDFASLHVVSGLSKARLDASRLERLGAREVLQSPFEELLGRDPAPFDLVFVEGFSAETMGLREVCLAAGCVILSGIGDPAASALCSAVMQAGTHVLLAHDPAYGAGYAVFDRWRARAMSPASPRSGHLGSTPRPASQQVSVS